MGKTHWKRLSNPDFLGAYALEPGQDLILTIASVNHEQFTGLNGKHEEGMIIRFRENVQPMICNVTNAKMIQKVTGTPYIEEWAGHQIQLYAAETQFMGETVEALRVRPFEPRREQYICADCGREITSRENFTARAIAMSTREKFGRELCLDCGNAEKERREGVEEA